MLVNLRAKLQSTIIGTTFGALVVLFSPLSLAQPNPPVVSCDDAGTTCVSGAPYDLSAHTIPFAVIFPTAPNTTQSVTVTTMTALQNAVTVDGNDITIPASFGTQSGNVDISGVDINITMSNSATINGRIQFGAGANFRARRVRWTGGNQTLGPLDMDNAEDILIDNFHGITNNFSNNFSGNTFQRIAVINSTLEVTNGDAGGSWSLFMTPGNPGHTDMIIANVRMQAINGNAQTNRFQGITRLIIVDSAFNAEGTGANGARIQRGCVDVYMADTIVVGGWLMGAGNTITGVTNFIGERITTYGSNNQIASMHPSNTGVYNNGPTFRDVALPGGEVDLTPFTGSNNIIQVWDSVPPGSGTIGADH